MAFTNDDLTELLLDNPEWLYERPDRVEWLRECVRLGMDPGRVAPIECTHEGCTEELLEGGGYVGETIVHCPVHGILWEDAADAIRRAM